ncbi:asialoglycoprotein receptor 1-like [Epinephelus lanceolatus]|uniref:asialoglycoprotein receptor 1-like n=1 Tax=Epinephelus lanceolatus TaxID=310571 RepID=UPI001446C25A|nr:asialoglycoprotein receptor 1-like [Epinephelus lanceolatus]
MQQMEVADYVNERPRREQKRSGDGYPTGRRLCQLLFLGFGVLCIVQAILNVSLRLTVSSSKESTHSDCNTTHFCVQNNTKMVPRDCEGKKPDHCNRLQERFNALTAEKNDLQNRNNDLTNRLRNVEEERDRLKQRLGVPSGCLSSQQCPADWSEINSRCYFLSTEKRTWEDSRKYCQSKDADLVVINSEQEQRALYRLDGDADLLFWIGLSDTKGTNRWTWVDGSELTKSFWQSGQPDRSPTKVEDCVEMYHLNPVQANWNDAPCRVQRRWLCETELCPRVRNVSVVEQDKKRERNLELEREAEREMLPEMQ